MRIYVAALYSMMSEAAVLAQDLRAAGHEITAQWIEGNEENKTLSDAARMDINDVERADALVLITLPYGTAYKGGGRHVEFGYALARNKYVFVLGERETIFCNLPQVTVCDSIEQLKTELGRISQ